MPQSPTVTTPADPPQGALAGKRIVVGVSGGIAAYKAVEVIRRLVDAGAHVAPIMTNAAHRFIGETTLSALSSEPVQKSLWDEDSPIPHTRLGQGADAIVVVPATARLIGSYAAGISNDLLTATLLATRAPVVVCPAMHTEMWEHQAVQDNLATLRRRGVRIVDPEPGRLAGGDIGHGRLAAPRTVVAAVERAVGPDDLAGLHVLITAGGTREAIDPVRVISNRSSGKQGYALAAAASARGARVTLVTTVERDAHPGVEVVEVASAADMQAAVVPLAPDVDVLIMAAAVADFRPADVADHKIKKDEGVDAIALARTHDFLVDLGAAKPVGQTLVGFAAETENLEANARGKLERKHLDLIVANDVSMDQVGFAHDTNEVLILSADEARPVPLTTKRAVADAVLDAVIHIRSSDAAESSQRGS
jgi:phosphopantothenoylcysteine decarboxylase/phosphopantothenate--cysteine ligase